MCWQATEKPVFLSNECVDELADNRKISHKEGSILYCGICTSFFKFRTHLYLNCRIFKKYSAIIIDFDFFIWYYKNNKLSKCLTINNEGFPKNEKRT